MKCDVTEKSDDYLEISLSEEDIEVTVICPKEDTEIFNSVAEQMIPAFPYEEGAQLQELVNEIKSKK